MPLAAQISRIMDDDLGSGMMFIRKWLLYKKNIT
jgi:hypothetical protein